MRSINDVNEIETMMDRIQQLSAGSVPDWGKMSVNEMLCHISDALRDVLGIRIVEPVTPEEIRPQIIQMVLTEEEWDHHLPTFPPYLQGPEGGGTKPVNFNTDKESLLHLLQQYKSLDAGFSFYPHAGLGILTRDQCGKFLWKHLDHHLRQFGV
jgi:hypothetical protein